MIIKGKPVADEITAQVKAQVMKNKTGQTRPGLGLIRAGSHPSDLAYEKGALSRMEKCGISTKVVALPQETTQKQLIDQLKKLNDDPTISGILIFRPLPEHLDEEAIQKEINPDKDVDCFSPINLAKVMADDATGFPPATPAAVMAILEHYKVALSGKRCVVLGRSLVVGKPLSMMLLRKNATVTICHSRTENIEAICQEGDIVIAAIGQSKMIKKSWLKPGAVVIDVGINVDEQGQLSGDVDLEDCLDKVAMITPVPAGVGSVTSSILAKHVLKASIQ